MKGARLILCNGLVGGLIIDVFLCIKKILVLNIVIASRDGSFLVGYFGEVRSSG